MLWALCFYMHLSIWGDFSRHFSISGCKDACSPGGSWKLGLWWEQHCRLQPQEIAARLCETLLPFIFSHGCGVYVFILLWCVAARVCLKVWIHEETRGWQPESSSFLSSLWIEIGFLSGPWSHQLGFSHGPACSGEPLTLCSIYSTSSRIPSRLAYTCGLGFLRLLECQVL